MVKYYYELFLEPPLNATLSDERDLICEEEDDRGCFMTSIVYYGDREVLTVRNYDHGLLVIRPLSIENWSLLLEGNALFQESYDLYQGFLYGTAMKIFRKMEDKDRA